MNYVLLLIPLFSLTYHGNSMLPALLAGAALFVLYMRRASGHLRKWWYYLGLMPFFLWWFLAPPGGDSVYGVPWLLFEIPGWYFLTLAFIQLFSLGKGGSQYLLWWNAGASLLVSGMKASPVFYVLAFLFALLLLRNIRKDRNSAAFPWVNLLIVILLATISAAVGLNLRTQRSSGGDWASFQQIRGFSPVSFLGSFAEEYASPFENQIVLRVYADSFPDYMRGSVYREYRSGHWRQDSVVQWVYPAAQKVEFSVFGDSSAGKIHWIHSSVTTGGFLLLPYGTTAVGVQADSLIRNSAAIWQAGPQEISRGWFAWAAADSVFSDGDEASWLQVPGRLRPWLDSVSSVIGLNKGDDPYIHSSGIASWFAQEFRYAMRLNIDRKKDPLLSFVNSREGYCEYFASLTVLLLRQQGVPARYVTGFAGPAAQGDGVWAFRRRDAHAWVEFWHAGEWHLSDPTPAAARPVPSAVRFWEPWLEKWNARSLWWLHRIRDGEWKIVLVPLQNGLEKMLRSTEFYLALILFLIFIFTLNYFRNRRKIRSVFFFSDRRWGPSVEKAERQLARQGWQRNAGETVGMFLGRLPSHAVPDAVLLLRQYQAERFQPPAERDRSTSSIHREFQPPGASPVK